MEVCMVELSSVTEIDSFQLSAFIRIHLKSSQVISSLLLLPAPCVKEYDDDEAR